jgi:hypothetical protein
MITVDARCSCSRCVDGPQDIYRMIGMCANCGSNPILMIFRAGILATGQTCPLCGVLGAVERRRMARDDEIPEA